MRRRSRRMRWRCSWSWRSERRRREGQRGPGQATTGDTQNSFTTDPFERYVLRLCDILDMNPYGPHLWITLTKYISAFDFDGKLTRTTSI